MEPQPRTEKCKEVFTLLSEYLNLELPPEVCREIESHLAGCAPCEEFAESLRKTVDICRHHLPTELPRPLAESARAELMAAWQRMLEARRH